MPAVYGSARRRHQGSPRSWLARRGSVLLRRLRFVLVQPDRQLAAGADVQPVAGQRVELRLVAQGSGEDEEVCRFGGSRPAGSVTGDTTVRRCSAPSGKAVFVPLINDAYCAFRSDPPRTARPGSAVHRSSVEATSRTALSPPWSTLT